MSITRREFVKSVTVGGIALSVSRLGFADQPAFDARETLPGRQAWKRAATGAGRIDGLAKVTGAKLYASDFRATDLPGWPAATSHALLIRATDATHVFEGIDLVRLGGAAKPSRVVTATEVAGAGIRVPDFYRGDLFCPVGKTPLYLGQPLALLVFDHFDAYDQARAALREESCVRYGKKTESVQKEPYGSNRFVRVAGLTPDAPDVYSPLLAGWARPRRFQTAEFPVWAKADRKGSADARASFHGDRIRTELAAADSNRLVLEREFETQSIDPVFLEPECGLAWYDPSSKKLELVLGVQSPGEAVESFAYLLGAARNNFKPARIHAHFAHVGGGFGGRDHTGFILYVALAAMFSPNRPVRLGHDRYQQFQAGLKRHAFQMRTRIGVDRRSGKIQAFVADHRVDGGGLANFSASVADVGATGAIGIYDIPKVDVTTVAIHSRGVPAGSMRGYGTLQTMTALEVLIDEVATELRLDPIEFRRRNALKTGGRTLTGNPLAGAVRTEEILDRLAGHPLWRDRAAEKAARQQAKSGILAGIGVACVTKDFGSGADSSLACVEISADGRIAIRSNAVEMGNGIGTALAQRVADSLGEVADEVALAQNEAFSPLRLMTSGDPWSIDQTSQDKAARNPRWVPQISSPSSSSIGAFVSTHGAAEAARIVFRFGLWSAALELWGIPETDPKARQWADARWENRQLVLTGLRPLSLEALSTKAHARGFVTAAMVHGFSRWEWANARFNIGGETWTADIDALAIRTGAGSYVPLQRTKVHFPPTLNERFGTVYSSACGSLACVEIDRASGAVRIAKAYTVVECGRVLVPRVVVGQAQGGFAMGVGYALLESLPLYEEGPGNGQWNLGQYRIARASDLPLDGVEVDVLPPLSANDRPKGMAEVVMIPIVPAILNAIHDATGHRFQSLPVTPSMLKGVLS